MAGSADIQGKLLGMVTSKQSYSALVQWLQQNPDAVQTVSQALQPGDQPSPAAVLLPAGLVEALGGVWADLEAAAFQSPLLENLCWTAQQAVVPAAESVAPADGNWQLKPFSPVAKINLPAVGYSKDGTLSLQMLNNAPRHVCAYATFFNNQLPVAPAGWTSRLPAGVPSAFETDTAKFLAVISPNTPVSGLTVDGAAQSLSFPIAANADSVQVVFGGLGCGAFAAVQSAGGALLTYVLDYAVPWIISRYPRANVQSTKQWYQSLLGNTALLNAVIGSGAFIPGGSFADAASLLDNLAANFTAIFLSDALKPLRDAIDKQFGSITDTVGPSQKFAPTLGWSGQIVAAMMRRSPPTQSWLSQAEAAATLSLSASTAVELEVLITPDPRQATWPFTMAKCDVVIGYGDDDGSFTQTQSVPVAVTTAAATIPVAFGSVRNAGVFDIKVSLEDESGHQLAAGNLRLVGERVSPANRSRTALVTLQEAQIVVSQSTKFVLRRTLNFKNGAYSWEATAGGVTGSGVSLVDITLQEAAQSLGYVWNVAGAGINSCSGGGTLTQAYLMQNIGTIVPAAQLKTTNCGFVQQPGLAYGRSGGVLSPDAALGFFLDSRGAWPCLRQITFGPGPFDLSQQVCRGRFREGPLDDLAIHPSGYAVAVSSVNNRLEIVKLSATAIADDVAPLAQVYGGLGQRQGLLSGPLAVAITPGGFLLVLEQGNNRLQAFDVHGNCAALFAGSSLVALQSASGAQYQDLAISPFGYIYVLWGDVAGTTSLDVYGAEGSFLCRTSGVNAGKIAVDSRESVFTLNYATFTGLSGQAEPSISVWTPQL